MWDTVQTNQEHLSHDPPCPHCGHPAHTYLACSATCGCLPQLPPGGDDVEYDGYAAA